MALQALKRGCGLYLIEPQDDEQAIARPYEVPENYEDFLKLLRIRSGNKRVQFIPYEYQVELSKIIDSHRGVVVFKTRQLGITEAIAAKMLHKAMLNPAYLAAVLSLGQKESSNVSKRVRAMPSTIPNFRFANDSKTEVSPASGGTILFQPSTPNAIRSLESVSDLLFDEAAFPSDIEEIYSSATPAQEMLGEEARTLVISTMSPLGELSWFWREMFDRDNPVDAREMVERVKDGREEPFTWWTDKSGWAKVIIHWKAHPIYSLVINYLEETKRKRKLTEEKLQREYNLGIPEAGGSLFNTESFKVQAVGAWQPPLTGHRYICCIDPNFGGSDFWVAQFWDVTKMPYALVHEYRESDRQTTYCRKKTIELMDQYKPILTAVESNSGGIVVAENMVGDRPNMRIEVTLTTHTSKRINTDRIALAVEQGEVIYPADWEGISEAKRFSALTREATSGHDDTITCWAAGWAWIDDLPKPTRASAPKAPARENSTRSIRQQFAG